MVRSHARCQALERPFPGLVALPVRRPRVRPGSLAAVVRSAGHHLWDPDAWFEAKLTMLLAVLLLGAFNA